MAQAIDSTALFDARLPIVVGGERRLFDVHVLDKLADTGVDEAVVNVHYLPDQIIDHVKGRAQPRIIISDERDAVLGTGGGVVKALPLLGDAPFFHLNADTLWIDGAQPNLARLADAFDPARMDILLLMAPTAGSIGYAGNGDYAMSAPRSNIPPAVREAQARASNPEASSFVAANAGSGKTHVLVNRVIRLLLNGVPPEKILCITFTKAAAANMPWSLRYSAR